MTSNTSKRIMEASLLAVCVLVSLPALSQSHQTQPVLVVNGSGAPVPTVAQGTTNVAGTVNLSSGSTVNVGNTPSVNVANSPTVNLASGSGVNVSNPLLAPQNDPVPLVTLEGAQPYNSFCDIDLVNGPNQCDFSPPVPAGKRLVIQEFDGFGVVDTGLKPLLISVNSLVGGSPHFFPATFMGSDNGRDYFATHQETRIYLTPNQTPRCFATFSGVPSGSAGFTCAISGFLVDVP